MITRQSLAPTALLFIALLLSACAGKGLPPQKPHTPPHGDTGGDQGLELTDADAVGEGALPDGVADEAPRSAPSESHRPALEAKRRRPAHADPFALQPSPPESRPGLGTRWGETRFSAVSSAPFSRADELHPFGQSAIFYNDARGLSELVRGRRRHRSRRQFTVAGGHLDFSVRHANRSLLSGFSLNGRNYVRGRSGQRYTIVVRNHSPGRVEAVLSVDGLDVIDGRPASFRKRGYLIAPFGELTVDGFRRNHRQVAAFRFGSVRDSYAGRKHGDTRNVGVIGLAVFHERGDSPRFWRRSSDSDHRRHQADPFPNRFATP